MYVPVLPGGGKSARSLPLRDDEDAIMQAHCKVGTDVLHNGGNGAAREVGSDGATEARSIEAMLINVIDINHDHNAGSSDGQYVMTHEVMMS